MCTCSERCAKLRALDDVEWKEEGWEWDCQEGCERIVTGWWPRGFPVMLLAGTPRAGLGDERGAFCEWRITELLLRTAAPLLLPARDDWALESSQRRGRRGVRVRKGGGEGSGGVAGGWGQRPKGEGVANLVYYNIVNSEPYGNT